MSWWRTPPIRAGWHVLSFSPHSLEKRITQNVTGCPLQLDKHFNPLRLRVGPKDFQVTTIG